MSSKYTATCGVSCKMFSMVLWEIAGAELMPYGNLVYRNNPVRVFLSISYPLGVVNRHGQVQLRELFPTFQFLAEFIQCRNWILLQMGDTVHRKFVVSAISELCHQLSGLTLSGLPSRSSALAQSPSSALT